MKNNILVREIDDFSDAPQYYTHNQAHDLFAAIAFVAIIIVLVVLAAFA